MVPGKVESELGLVYTGLPPQSMREPRKKLTPVGHEDATCLDFKRVPLYASRRTSWLPVLGACTSSGGFPQAEGSLN